MADALAAPGAASSPPPPPPPPTTDALLPALAKIEHHGDSVFGVLSCDATLLYASPNAGRVFAVPPGGLAGCVWGEEAALRNRIASGGGASDTENGALTRVRSRDGAARA